MSQLRAIVERIEKIEAEIAEMNSDKSDIFKEAKHAGFDVKALKAVIAYRRKDPAERKEQETLVDLYLAELSGKPAVGTHHATRARTTRSAKVSIAAGTNAPAERLQTGHVSVSPSNDLSLATSAQSAPAVQAQPIVEPSPTAQALQASVAIQRADPYPDMEIPAVILAARGRQ